MLKQQRQAEDFAGLKLVIDPTGMGKTSAIPGVITHLRSEGIENRCIYTSHRHLLIQEMEDALKKAKVPSVYLKSDEDVVDTFLEWSKKKEFLDRLDDVDFFKFAGHSQ